MTDPSSAETVEPIEGPTSTAEVDEAAPPPRPRLTRHTIELSDGHQVALSMSGRGIPLVVVHGFSAEGFLYAQTLSRLVGMGYRVIAIDTAGHGGTHGLPRTGAQLADYAALLRRTLDDLGVHRAVLAGHSMGGRLVTEFAAAAPHRVIALLLLDAIVGEPWDRIVRRAFDGANITSQGFSTAECVEQYHVMKPSIGWMHIKDYQNPHTKSRSSHVDEEMLKNFVPAEEGESGHEAILRDFANIIPDLERRLKRRGIPGVILDLEPHLKGGGQFGGFSGPDGMGVALRSLTRVLDFVGIHYHLRNLEDIRAARGF